MLAHIQTVMQATFAWIGEDGNITETRVVNAAVPALTQEAFDKAYADICEAREQIRQDFTKGAG
jgi:hypothetical protein